MKVAATLTALALKPMLVDDASTKGNIIIKPLMKSAKDAGLDVHPYTFRADPGKIPSYADNFDVDVFYNQVEVVQRCVYRFFQTKR